MSGLKTLSYIDRLAKLGIDSLERRRLNHDLMLCYKLQNNLCDSSISNLFKPGYAATRGNGFKLAELSSELDITIAKLSSELDINIITFVTITVDIWNSLSFDLVS